MPVVFLIVEHKWKLESDWNRTNGIVCATHSHTKEVAVVSSKILKVFVQAAEESAIIVFII